jgi:prevent-host-death family protein
MRQITASEVQTDLLELLDDVERGETVIITRNGRPIARIVPEAEARQLEIDQALDSIKQRRKRNGRIALGDLLTARDEGRRF